MYLFTCYTYVYIYLFIYVYIYRFFFREIKRYKLFREMLAETVEVKLVGFLRQNWEKGDSWVQTTLRRQL